MTAHTDTVSRDMGDDETFGLVHVLPNNYVDEFTAAFDSDEFTEYLAYGTAVDGFMFVVTEFIDPETERSILLPSRYDMALADGMVSSATDEGVLYTHVQTIDGTILGTFERGIRPAGLQTERITAVAAVILALSAGNRTDYGIPAFRMRPFDVCNLRGVIAPVRVTPANSALYSRQFSRSR